jgi:hypothetical protein
VFVCDLVYMYTHKLLSQNISAHRLRKQVSL